MKAIRKQLIELEDGSVQFSLVVAQEDVDALLAIAPMPGDAVELTTYIEFVWAPPEEAKEPATEPPPVEASEPAKQPAKPPTQTVAPAGESHSAFGQDSALEARQALALCNNPWFQQYARAKRPDAKNPDDLVVARGYMVTTVAPGGKWTTDSVSLFQGVMKDYKAWCQAKGYVNG